MNNFNTLFHIFGSKYAQKKKSSHYRKKIIDEITIKNKDKYTFKNLYELSNIYSTALSKIRI